MSSDVRQGRRNVRGFRFHQQDLGSDGTVVLVWTIGDSGDGTLVIEPTTDRCTEARHCG